MCPRTLANDCNEIKVDCADDASNLCENTSNKLNPEAIGKILGKSCFDIPPLDVMKSRAGHQQQIAFNQQSIQRVQIQLRNFQQLWFANGSLILIPEEELHPILKATVQTPMVENPFLPASSSISEINQGFWPNNLIQIVKGIVSLPSIQPSDPELKFSLDREAAMINFNVLKNMNSS